MSNHRQATAPGPSRVSIAVMAAATLGTIGVGLWILNGWTDGRHLAGAGLAFVLAVVLTAQTMGRAYERVAAVERAACQRRYAGLVRPEDPDHMLLEHWASGGELDPESDRYPQDPDPVATQPIPIDDSPTEVIHMRY